MSLSSCRHICTAIQVSLSRSLILGLLLLAAALFPTRGQAAGIALVQHTSKDAGTTTTSTLAFATPNTAGNWIAVSIRGGLSSSQIFTVVDSNGNTYRQAGQIGFTSSAVTLAIYYAENIKGGADTITISDTVSGPLRFAILEYSGVATSNSLDVAAVATGIGSSPNSGNATTTANGDLLLGTIATADPAAFTAGVGYTIRDSVPVPPNTKLISEDQIQASPGVSSAGASLAASASWGAVLAAFKPAGGTAGTPSTITATAGTPQSATVNTAFATQLQATVKDSFNNPVSGATVTFAAPASGASGTFAGAVNTATTNASGVATAAVFTANGTAGGPYNVTASVTGVATPANFSLTNLAGAAASITATAGTPQSAAINTAFATQLQATVIDSLNNPVSGTTVTFTAPTSGASGTFAGGVNTATTNAQGIATAPVFTANGTTGGPYTVTASVSGVATQASFSLTNLASSPFTWGNMDEWLQMNTSSPGTALTSAILAAGSVGTPVLSSWTLDQSNSVVSSTSAFTVAASQGSMGGSITVNGVTYPVGTTTQSLALNNNLNFTYVTTSKVSAVKQVVANGFITFGQANAGTAGGKNVDMILLNDTNSGATVVLQLNNGNPCYCVRVESNGAVGFHTSANIAITPGHRYSFSLLFDEIGGTAKLVMFDPSNNFAQVGSTATVVQNTGFNFSSFRFGDAEAGTSSGTTTYFEDLMLDWTNHVFPNAPHASGVAGTPSTITATAGTPQSATVSTAFATQLQATVKDSFNNPVTGVTVTFAAPASGASGAFAGGVNTATTNSLGVATAAVFTANSTAGAYTVTASVSGVSTPANFSLTNLAGAAASITATAGTPQSAAINTAFATQLQATVKDSFNNPVTGVTVTFAAPASGASGAFAGGVNTATTNSLGVATATVFTANSTAGAYTVTASVSGVSTPANFSLTNLANPPASITATAGTPQSATINTAFATQLQATVRDSGNNPVSGVTVTFTAPASGASGAFAGGVNTATTNASGVATAAVFTANSTAGSDTVTASVSGVSTPANFSLTNLASTAASITAAAGTPQSATINTAFATQLQATVKDSFNNPVNGVTVTFAAPASGASGTFAGGVNTATTNASGVATAAVFTANGTAGGPYTVTASVSGVSSPANFSLTNLASTPSSIALVQHTSLDLRTTTTGALAFKSNNTAGNWIAVCVRGGNSSSQVFTITDSLGNTYRQATQLGFTASAVTLAIYYVENIKGGANTITVSDTVSGPLRFAILEYSGVATSNSLDVTAMAQGNSTSPNTGNLTTTASGDLLLGSVATTNPAVFTAGSGYTIEEFVGVEPGSKLIAEDQIQGSAGVASASASLGAADVWGAVLASFKAAGGGGGTGPTITSLNPTSGAVGTSVTITGTNFGSSVGSSTVTFNGTPATTISNWSATSIIVPVPAGATTGPVVVTVSGVPSNGVAFTVVPTPNITSLSPTSGSSGTSVTIAGTNFGGSQGPSTVTFNGISAGTATSWSATSIVIPVPNGATTGSVVVTVSGVSSNGVLFTVTSPGPSITSLSLTQGPVGATLTVNGANFGTTQGSSTVTFNGVAATATSNWSTANFNVTVPTGATTGNVVVTVGGVPSNGVLFTVTPPPSITSISPTSGPIGTNVIITGTNFGPTVGTIQSFVTFNGTQTRASNWTDTSITAPVPTGATTGNVLVNVGGVPSNGVLFTVTPPPSITSLSPNSGPVGTSVTIAGANFGASQGTSTVTFNGTAATPTSWSATSIVVPVPAGATPGNVVVTVSGAPSNGVNFTVTSTTGNIALVQHTSLDAGTTTSAPLAFTANTFPGNFIAVSIRAGSSNAQVFTVSDSNGNTYRQAYQLGLSQTAVTFALYYAENIKGGADTITVSASVSGPLRFAILEYSGVAATNSLDASPLTAQGNSTAPSSGNLTTNTSGDLLLATIVTPDPVTYTAGTGYTIEASLPAAPNTKFLTEDQLQRASGVVAANATLSSADPWGVGLAAFRSASGAGLPISVSVSPTSASVPTGYGTQAFSATVSNDFQSQGVTWVLSGTGCSGVTCGTLSNVTITSVTYNGPANLPSPASMTLTATSVSDTTKSASATITITQGALHVSVSPRRAALPMSASQTVQFTATVTNDPQNLGVTWQVDGSNGGTATTGTVSTTGLFTPGTQPGQHTVTAVSNANASVTASSMVAVTDLTGVYTHHNDIQRTGQNVKEYGLTPTTVNSSVFGPLFSCPVDGFLYAQPLWVANLTFGSTTRNVVFVATEHDSVYAFDADSPSCVQLWKVSFLGPGVTTLTPSDLSGNQDVIPEIGITSTPVIDPATNTIYVMPKTKETVGTVSGVTCTTSAPCFVHRLHALDLVTGAEKFGGPMIISAPNFAPFWHLQRPALTLANGTLYIAFGSHGDHIPYFGWVMGYDPATLAQKFATPLTDATGASGTVRGGVWGSGAGPAIDASGNVYVSTGNGFYDGTKNFGDSAIKLSSTGAILDWFTPFNQSVFNANDIDLGSAGITILPDSVGSATHPHLALATGKVAILYLLDQTNMGKNNSSTNSDVQEVIPVPPPNTTLLDGGNYGNIAFWSTGPNTGNIYTTGQNFPLSQFQVSNGVIATPQAAKSTNSFPPRGGIPVVSANGTTNGVVWILDLSAWASNGDAILDAYDATNVSTLLFSSPVSGTGAAGPAVKWSVPTVANSKVYVGGQYTFTVFGLLP